MIVLLTISMLINIAVLGLIIPAIWRNSPAMVQAYGPDAPARDIVLAVYIAIFVASIIVLGAIVGGQSWARTAALMILPVQVSYKALTVLTVGPGHPVVQANIIIAAWHTLALASFIY